nr:MAG TPA: hypothetical protein [Caudoviricetes sp.]
MNTTTNKVGMRILVQIETKIRLFGYNSGILSISCR